MLRTQEAIHLVESAGPSSVAAADAFAEGSIGGLAVEFLPSNVAMGAHNTWWFSVQLERAALPAWFLKGPSDLQGRIAALEALAQLVLLECQELVVGTGGTAHWVSMRQWCDNAGGCRFPEGLIFEAAISRCDAVFDLISSTLQSEPAHCTCGWRAQ